MNPLFSVVAFSQNIAFQKTLLLNNEPQQYPSSFDGADHGSVKFADTDNDLLITGINNSVDRITKLYINEGICNFSEVIGTSFEGVRYRSVVFGDVDNDDDLDVFIPGETNVKIKTFKLYENDGPDNFSEVTGTPFDSVYLSSATFGDVNNDNYLDLIITGS